MVNFCCLSGRYRGLMFLHLLSVVSITVNRSLVIKIVGCLVDVDIERLDRSLRVWLGL